MSVAVVASVRAQYPTPMTLEQCVKCCNEVAYRLNGNSAAGPWGLRAKTDGTQWGGYSKDVIVHRETGQLIDIMINSPATSIPAWQDVGVNASYYAPVRVEWLATTPEPPTPPPAGPPPSSGDLAATVTALEARVARLEARFRQAGEVMGGV